MFVCSNGNAHEVCTMIRYCLFCICKGSGVVIALILNSDLESKKEMWNDDDNYL